MMTVRHSRILEAIAVLLISVILCPISRGKTIYVDDGAMGANDGSSWVDAYNYLQDALADATDSDKPVEIRVAQGIYKPDRGANQTPGNREAAFQLVDGVTLMGGYAGSNEADANERDIGLYETILSGDLTGDDVEVVYDRLPNLPWEPTRAENSHHVVVSIGSRETAVLDGFTITAGNANGSGGGLRCVDGDPTIRNCIFRHNAAQVSGGGMATYVSDEDEGPFCDPTLAHCVLVENVAAWNGGGLSLDELCSPVLTDCRFKGNHATRKGGGMIAWDGSKPTFVRCTFEGNRAGTDGGGLHLDDSTVTLADCTFAGNSADRGGGIFDLGFQAVLTRCELTGNSADRQGGGIWSSQGRLTLTDCVIEDNHSTESGGGAHCQGSPFTGLGCRFTDNYAREGGAMTMSGASLTLANCLFTLNRATAVAWGHETTAGAAIFVFGDEEPSVANLTHCVFWGNSATFGSALACSSYLQLFPNTVAITNCILWDGPDSIFNSDNSTITVTYSDIYGGWPGEGNIDADPMFGRGTDWDNEDFVWIHGDFHLKSQAGRWDPNLENWVTDSVTSPCIDAGDPSSNVTLEPFPNGGVVNMGIYGGTAEASKSPSGLHTQYGGGMGEPNDPYLIYTAEHLNALGAEPNDWDKHFKLMVDIDLNAYTGTHINLIGKYAGWLDTRNRPFTGVFDGNNKSICNFHWTSEGFECVGLFRIVGKGGLIKDLRMENVDVTAGAYLGALIGLNSYGTVERCSVTGSVMSYDTMVGEVGGLVGHNSGTLNGCYFEGSVAGQDCVGGLVGAGGGSINNCCFVGSVTGVNYVGGLVGEHSGSVTASFVNGTVSGDTHVGGIAGDDDDGTILDSYSTASVSGSEKVGGLVGSESGGILNRCYAAGPVLGTGQLIGGLAGSGHGLAKASFWDVEVTGQSTSVLGAGKTTAEMQLQSTFTNTGWWDFVDETTNGTDDIWWIDEGQDYPRLWWELGGE